MHLSIPTQKNHKIGTAEIQQSNRLKEGQSGQKDGRMYSENRNVRNESDQPHRHLERSHVIATSPGGRNQLRTIFVRDLDEFCDAYDERYAAKYGMFRLDRIRDIGKRILICGDYRLGVARIRCTNPSCGHCRNRLRFLPAERRRRSADYISAFQL